MSGSGRQLQCTIFSTSSVTDFVSLGSVIAASVLEVSEVSTGSENRGSVCLS